MTIDQVRATKVHACAEIDVDGLSLRVHWLPGDLIHVVQRGGPIRVVTDQSWVPEFDLPRDGWRIYASHD